MPCKVHALAVADDEVLSITPLQVTTLCTIDNDAKKVIVRAVIVFLHDIQDQ